MKTFFFVFLGISITFSDPRTFAVGLIVSIIAIFGRSIMVRLLAPRSVPRRDAMLMTALIPKGLAAAVLASLPVQMGLADGEIVQGTVYAVIFFSIVMCAIIVFVSERGKLDQLSLNLFKPFAAAESAGERAAYVSPFEQSLGLPALQEEAFLEPNVVQLTPEPTGDEQLPTTRDAPLATPEESDTPEHPDTL
ncbi:MAG: cation:proton antiporter [Phycisphaerales bacterium]